MAAFDWNGDGKTDLYDDMLKLHNARQSMKNESDSFIANYSRNKSQTKKRVLRKARCDNEG